MEREEEHWKASEVARLLSLVEAERRYYQDIVAEVPIGLLIVSSSLAILSSNREIRRQLALPSGDSAVPSAEGLLPPEVVETLRMVLQTGHPSSVSMRSPGAERVLRIQIQRIHNWAEDSGPQALLTVENTATSPGTAALDPADGGVPAGEVLDGLDAIAWAVEVPSMRFLYVNDKAQDLLGHPVEKWLRSPTFWSDRIHSADRAWVMEAYRRSIANWSRLNCEFRAVASHGRPVWLRENARLLQDPQGRARHLIGFSVDVTRRHLLEGQAARSQRADAAGALARRVAAEITNQVTVISGYSEEMLAALGSASPFASDLRAIQSASARLASLAEQLTAAQRVQVPAGEPVDLIALLQTLQPALQRSAGPSIELEWKLFPAPLGVKVHAQVMEEVLAPFAWKARQNGAGRLKIECAPLDLEEAVNPAGSALPSGSYAVLSLEDNGETMSSESRDAFFDSFLLSRELEDLGPALAKAYASIRHWGGNVSVIANLPKGNLIRIYLPLAGDAPSTVESRHVVIEPSTQVAEPRSYTILVAEDEPAILTLIAKMLRRQSYAVIEAKDSGAAVQACQENAGRIDLLIADIEMAPLHTQCPGPRVLYLSAQPDPGIGDHAWLAKPFTAGSLIQKVRDLIG